MSEDARNHDSTNAPEATSAPPARAGGGGA